MKNFHFNNLNYSKPKYLNTCDLLNKFRELDVCNCSRIEKIIIHFSLKDFLISTENVLKNKEIKSFLFSILFFAKNPYIHFKKLETKGSKSSFREQNGEYSLKLVLFNTSEIYSFLFYFFYEIYSTLKKEELIVKKKDLEIRNLYSFIVPLSVLIDFSDVFNRVLTHIDTKDVLLNIDFVISGNTKQKSVFRNLPLIWCYL
jgi:hypothetical protein